MENKEKKDWSYKIVRKVIPELYLNILDDYFSNKREIYKTMIKNKFISETETTFGLIGDRQPGVRKQTYGIYGDIMTEMLMSSLKNLMEKETNMSLVPSYGYMRIYEKGDELEPHKDRDSCEISTTLNISGDNWPIFLQTDEEKPIKAELEPGDLLIYKGCEQLHWREIFKGDTCTQVFLHYNNINGPYGLSNKFDKRPSLGLPQQFKVEEIKDKYIKPKSLFHK